MVPVAPVTSITVDPFAGLPRMCRGNGRREGLCTLWFGTGSVLGYGVGAAGLGSPAGLERASRRIICHTVGVCSVVDTTTVLPIVAESSASASR